MKRKATHLHHRKEAGKPPVVEVCDDSDHVLQVMEVRTEEDWDKVLKLFRGLMDRPCPVKVRELGLKDE